MRTVYRVLIVLAAIVCVPTLAAAQGSITGVVKDSSGAVLPGVTVEASSPVLIEKVRTAVTDGTGQYRIVDLRPGTYTVTFTLHRLQHRQARGHRGDRHRSSPRVNADLQVGTLEETITVTGESPIVDVQSVRRQTTVSGDVIATLPTSRSYGALFQLNPAVSGGSRDVQVMPGLVVFGGPGGRGTEGRLQVDGLNVGAAAERRRRVGLRPRHRELAGSDVHDVRRTRRSRSRRPDDEHRPEDRRQRDAREPVSRGRQRAAWSAATTPTSCRPRACARRASC